MSPMKTFLLLSALSVLSLTLAPPQARADDDTIIPERPGFTNGTATVSRRIFQFETGYQFSRNGKDSTHEIDNSAQVRFGLSPRTEIRFGIPAYDWLGGESGAHGSRDSSFSAKVRFLDGVQAKRPSLALIASTTLPTGSKVFQENHLQPQASLESHFDFSEKYSLEASVVYTDARSEGQQFNQYAGALNLGYNVSPALGLFVETYRISPTGLGSVSGSFVDGGVTYTLGKDTQFDVNGGTGVTRGVRSGFFVGAGIAHRFR